MLIVTFEDVRKGWEQWVLLRSDAHHDNTNCNRKLEKQHLDKAAERGALICDFGDLFCAMQGKYDPRSSMDDIRPEDVGADYLDRIVRHAAEDYAAYKDNWLVIGTGNHETNIRNRHGTDISNNLVYQLRSIGSNVRLGGYGGWVRFLFHIHKTKRSSINLKYHHGSGGGGEVTKGVIQTNRQAVYQPDANIIVNGHTHDGWYFPLARERLSEKGHVGRDILHFVRVPGYKDSYGSGAAGWDNEKWHAPKPLGCAWIRFWWDGASTGSQIESEITVDVT